MATAGTLRKNGQQPSCEPCRTSKLRCDHTVPVCQRCIARQQADQCIYHPCPLTKPRENRQRKEQFRTKKLTTPVGVDSDKLYEWASKAPSVPARIAQNQSPNEGDESFPSLGFLGPTSHSRDFFEHLKHFGCQSLSDVSAAPVDPRDVEVGAQILALLEHASFYKELLDRRFELFQGMYFGPPLAWETLSRLKTLYQECLRGSTAAGRQARLVEWSKGIFQNTATTIETHPKMTLKEYVAIIAPRWEMIGMLFGFVGRATYQISTNEAVLRQEDMPGKDKEGFQKITLAVLDMCLQFSHKLGIISDPLAWATIQLTTFLSDMHGPTDYRTFKSDGDVATVIFALGLHQGKVDERAPFFLSEIRSRTMVAAYFNDKELATFLGRPPHICRRYCNLQPPLDLMWEDMVADAPVRDAALRRLGPDGWDTQEHSGAECSKPRVILLVSTLREMILEVSLSYNIDGLQDVVKKIRHEINELRLGLPSVLQWSPETGNTHSSAASLHLEFLYQELLLSQTVAKRTGETPDSCVDTSREIIRHILGILSKQIRMGRVDYLTCNELCYIGLPAAGVLSKELLRQSHSHTNPPLNPSFPRSEVIQHLSIFAAHLETFFPDRGGDYRTRTRGLQFIHSVLDAVLSPPPNTANGVTQPETASDALSAIQLPGSSSMAAQSDAHALDDPQGLDFAALWEEIDFDWEGDRRVLLS
ncbi:hypothetical protein BDW59DRAFT_95303 [Aspergillus cavernicola]|uniref:Zn(2)-C6 fungal-type domain-containing protein n=1 Tax=Aspergillus cavernicola TaxID=176166 RepID=A0ABR4IZ89_9EURO